MLRWVSDHVKFCTCDIMNLPRTSPLDVIFSLFYLGQDCAATSHPSSTHTLDEPLPPQVLERLAVVHVALRVLKLLVDLRMESALGLVLREREDCSASSSLTFVLLT